MTFTLTPDQQAALNKFGQFLMDPTETVFVLAGYSGTGKSTLVATLLERLPGIIGSIKLLNAEYREKDIQLTATTNKAADTFGRITGMDVKTIHSFLGLRIHTDYHSGAKQLVPRNREDKVGNYLLFIDEASMIDPHLLGLIFAQTEHCKIVFIGDPAQLPPVKLNTTPVFSAGFNGAQLTQVMRQMVDGVPQVNPITELATAFRHTVNTGEWPQFKPDGQYVTWLPRDQFEAAIETEFTRPGWTYSDSKILAWTNNCVIAYNQHVRAMLKGDPALQVGDYAENNQFIQAGRSGIKTDQTVYISAIEEDTLEHDVPGNYVTVDHSIRVFHPHSREAKNKTVSRLRAAGDFSAALEAENWIDLRAVFAQTINKSQGSTYGKIFIDLDDIKRCNNGNQIARLMYVAVSRAQNQVYLTGDLV